MLDVGERKKIVDFVKHSVVPALGCTEPVCVALAAARAAQLLGVCPERVEARLSGNIIKNAMGVGVPGTQECGLPIAIALGALVGEAERGLEVLAEVSESAVEAAHEFIADERISFVLVEDAPCKLYVEVYVEGQGHSALARIARQHTHFVREEKDGEVLLDCALSENEGGEGSDVPALSLRKVYEFATTTPLDEIEFIAEAARLNLEVAEKSREGNYGHRLGKMLSGGGAMNVLGDTVYTKMLASTSCACDARMAGAMFPVMSNSGSGNQGICATNPVAVYAQEKGCSHEAMVRALMLSHLTAIYIKQQLGTLSALCGCVVAGTGTSCGITYLMGGEYEQICFAIQNMIGNITGMLCDGAKPSCALKLVTGVSSAVISAMLAMENEGVSSTEGIIDKDVEQSIRNMVMIGADAMNCADKCVLDIMTNK